MSALNGLNVAPNPNDSVSSVVPIGAMMMWGTSTPPTNWLICNGASLDINTYPALYSALGNTYSSGQVAPGGLYCGSYSVSAGTITFVLFGSQTNYSISAGDTFVATGFTTGIGSSINGVSFVCVTAPAIGAVGGNITATTTLTGTNTGLTGNVTRTNFNLPDTSGKVIRGFKTSTYTLGSTGGADTKTIAAANLPQHTHGITSFALSGANGTGGGSIGATTGQYYTAVGQTYLNDGTHTAVTNTALDVVNSYVVINYIIKYL